jgi:hypothetical protein
MIKLRRMRCAEYRALTGEMRNACRILVGKPRRRCEDTIETDHDLTEI